ncbi:MAG TPA: hypothetical protein DIV44_12360 [Leeuwenhoekiella sp.]|nr:hypothetical protein [Leeuwenhoekiella sp.]HCQ77592.1 hypothetical protein [Leeuwenhoekiella sp.]
MNAIKLPSVQNRRRAFRKKGAIATRNEQDGFCLVRQKIPKRGALFFCRACPERESKGFFGQAKKMNEHK